MKKLEYDNLQLKDDEQVFHMWEPLKFELGQNYKFIKSGIIFNTFSNLVYFIIYPILWVLNKILFGFKIEGKEKLKNIKSGKITISNHVHPMDCTMNGMINFPKRVYFLALANNFKIPVVRHLIRLLYAVPIPEKHSQKVKFFADIKKALLKGKTVHIYPEGALWPYYEKIRDFKKGAFKIAVDANVPIVPIIYKFENPKGIYKIYKKKKCIHAKVLEPIYPNHNLDKEQQIDDLQKRVLKEYENA